MLKDLYTEAGEVKVSVLKEDIATLQANITETIKRIDSAQA